MLSDTLKRSLLGSSMLATMSLGMVAPAFAQDAEGATQQTVVVTGSLIARQDYVANSPIVTVSEDDILATGVSTIDTLLTQMPQFVPAVNMTSNNPSNGGQANISLRGLGTNRTLVLLNGRRIVPATSGGTVDVNLVPSQLVGNIEVITGGASATYGSDALAGVTNFILRDIEGFELSATYGMTEQGDGYTKSISAAAGGDFADGRGKASFMLSFNDRDGIYNGARGFSSVSGPSGATPLGNTIFDTNNLPSAAAVSAVVPGAVPGNTFGFNNNGTVFTHQARRDFVSPGGITWDGFARPGPTFSPDLAYNTGPLNLLVIPQTRYNAFTQVSYEINPFAEVYGDFLFTEYESAQELAASPAAGATTGFRVPVTNPFITPELRSLLNSRPNPTGTFLLDKRFNALGPRLNQFLYDAYQGTAGVRGEMGLFDWTYDLYASYGRVNRTDVQSGNVSRSAVQRLLNAADGGASLCAGGFNWFGETTLSQACRDFIGITAKNLSVIEQTSVQYTMQGRGLDLPAGQQRIAVGISYREDDFRLVPDRSLSAPITTQPCIVSGTPPVCAGSASAATALTGNPPLTGNDVAGFNPSAPLSGTTDVYEVFAETLLPLLAGLPLVQELNLTLAGRISDYSTVGQVETWKADIDWTIVDQLRLRGGYQRAVRAPSIGELFAPVLLNFPNIGQPTTTGGAPQRSGDPCDIRSGYRSTSGTNLAASTNAQVRALCLSQGVAGSVIDTYTFTNQQVPGFTGGNPDLFQEGSDSWSVGLVWEPTFETPLLANLSASLDYYSIEIEDAIGTVAPSLAIQQCYNANGTSNPTYDPNNFFCRLFERNPLNGNILNASEQNQNLASAVTSGVDLQIDWSYDVGPGTLGVGFIGNWLEDYQTQALPGGAFTDFTGTIGNRGTLGSAVAPAFPNWKWLTTVDYVWGEARVGVRWQHIGEMENINNRADQIPAIGFVDLLGSYNVTDNVSLRFNINNIMDEQPPVYSPAIASNTDPATYDVLGRRYTVGVTMRY
jgi:outer membrane cobalamin receptor